MIEIEDGSMALGVKVQNREGEKERETHMRPSQRFWFGVKSETRSATDGEGRRAQRQNNPDSGRTFSCERQWPFLAARRHKGRPSTNAENM